MFSLNGEVLGYCDVLNLPEKLESGINSYSQVEVEDIEGDVDGDVDMPNVVKRGPMDITILELNHEFFYVLLVHFLWIVVNKKMWKNYVS